MTIIGKRRAYCSDIDLEARLGNVQAKVFEKIRWLIEQGQVEAGKVFGGRLWVHFTYDQLARYLPGQSVESVKHAVRALKRDGLLVSQLDGRGQWLAVNFERLAELLDVEAYVWYLERSRSVEKGLVAGPPGAVEEPVADDVATVAEAVPVEDTKPEPVEDVRGAAVAHPAQGRGAETAPQSCNARTPEVQRSRLSHIYRINIKESTQENQHTTPKPPPPQELRAVAGGSPPGGGGVRSKIIPFPVQSVGLSDLARTIGKFWRPDQAAFSEADKARLENVANYVRQTHKKFPRMPDVAGLVNGPFTIWWFFNHPVGLRGERLARIEKLMEWALWEAFCAWYLGRPNQDWMTDFERQCPEWREQLHRNYAGFRAKYQSKLENCWQGTGSAADYAALIHS